MQGISSTTNIVELVTPHFEADAARRARATLQHPGRSLAIHTEVDRPARSPQQKSKKRKLIWTEGLNYRFVVAIIRIGMCNDEEEAWEEELQDGRSEEAISVSKIDAWLRMSVLPEAANDAHAAGLKRAIPTRLRKVMMCHNQIMKQDTNSAAVSNLTTGQLKSKLQKYRLRAEKIASNTPAQALTLR